MYADVHTWMHASIIVTFICQSQSFDLCGCDQGAFHVESTMHELAALNQMFSTQIVQQAEQIELLYNQVGAAAKLGH